MHFTPAEVSTYYAVRFPELRQQGKEWRGACKIHHGIDNNFAVNFETGEAFCHSQCGRGWDILSLEQELTGVEFTQANAEVLRIIGHAKGNGTPTRVIPKPTVPRAAAAVRAGLERGGWQCHSQCEFGERLRQVRFEHRTEMQEGKGRPQKTFLWEQRIGDEWFSGTGDHQVPIYFNATARNSSQTGSLLLVEGWAKANAADALGIAAASLKEITDMNASQLSDMRHIVIWPDKDAPGIRLAASRAELLAKQNTEVFMIEPPAELPEGGDIVDAVALGWDREKIFGLINTAKRHTVEASVIRRVEDLKPMSSLADTGVVMVVDGILAEGRIALVTGEPGDGKTSWVSDMLYRVSRGELFAGRTTSKRNILILDRENPPTTLLAMYERLGIVEHEGFRVWGARQPDEPPEPDSLIILDWISRCDPKPVIVLDSLIAFLRGDENDATQTRAFMNRLRKLTAAGATIIGIHHVGKSETTKDFRGSSDFKAAIDMGVKITNRSGISGRLDRITVKAFKDRLGIFTEATFRFSLGGFKEERITSVIKYDQLVDLLSQHPRVSKTTFLSMAMKKCGVSRSVAEGFLEGQSKSIKKEAGPYNSSLFSWVGEAGR